MAEINTVTDMNTPPPRAEEVALPEATEEDAVAAALAEEETPVEPNPDEDEIEFEGEKIKVPKALAERVRKFDKAANFKMMQAADERKKIEAERVAFGETQRSFQVVAEDVTEIKGIDKQLEPYLKLTPQDWMNWADQDRDAASKAQIAITALQTKRGQLMGGLNDKIGNARAAETKAQETAAEEGRKAVQAAIKDWSPAREAELKAGATEHYKATAAHLQYIGLDAVATSVLNDAIKYRQALAKAKAGLKTAKAESAPELKAVPKVGGTAAATKDPEKMSGDEYRDYRNAQLARRRTGR